MILTVIVCTYEERKKDIWPGIHKSCKCCQNHEKDVLLHLLMLIITAGKCTAKRVSIYANEIQVKHTPIYLLLR